MSDVNKDDSSLDPFEINFLPEFEEGRGPRGPFVNEHGVVIGDHMYESENSPLQQWTEDTDPMVMAGEEWVHPFKDVGFQTEENRNYFEQGIAPQGGRFMHPDKDVAYETNLQGYDGEASPGNREALSKLKKDAESGGKQGDATTGEGSEQNAERL